MRRFLGLRAIRVLLVFVLVSLGTVSLSTVTPGDPAVAIAGETATPEVLTAVRETYGFDKPILIRWGRWVRDVVHANFGVSYSSRRPVMESVRQRLPVTVQLALMALIITLLAAVPLALYAAYHQGAWFDRAVTTFSAVIISIPGFVLALVFISLFALTFRLFPVASWVPLTENPVLNLKSAFLPSLTLGLGVVAVMLPVLRADVISTLEQDSGQGNQFGPDPVSACAPAVLDLGRHLDGAFDGATLRWCSAH